MTDTSIPIRNVYVMMAYAFRAIGNTGPDRIATERFEHLHDLLAEILTRGIGAQIKRGLHRDYLLRSDELAGVRGRIDLTSTIARHSTTRGRLVCEFDEYEADTPHNRALKSVMILLLRHGNVDSARKDAMRRLLPHLDAVTHIAPTAIRWNDLTYHRANATYRLLLGVCELIVRGLLPTHDAGTTKLNAWLSEDAMSQLYERFLREYYTRHHRNLSPGAPTVAWDLDATSLDRSQLPQMRTDVTLRNGQRTLIIDAKYYSQTLQTGAWGKSTIHSANLYQVLAYVKNEDTRRNGSVSGLLLYAHTAAIEQPNLDVSIQGNRVAARTLDLNQPWDHLRDQLEDIIRWWLRHAPTTDANTAATLPPVT